MQSSNRLVRALLRRGLRLWVKPFFGPPFSVGFQRRWIALAARVNRPSPAAIHRATTMDSVPAEQVTARGTAGNRQAVLYLHGGAYRLGSPRTHRSITGRLAAASGAAVYAIDYRLAPQAPFPAALEDALKAYGWLLANGYSPERIAIAGDSAGAGLALATALSTRERRQPAPACLLLISPWLDLTNPGAGSVDDGIDAMLRWDNLQQAAAGYAGDTPRQHPLISPLYADLRGLPPVLVQLGDEEILRGDAERLAASAAATEIRVYPGLWHVFPLHAGLLPEANTAIEQMADFMARHCRP